MRRIGIDVGGTNTDAVLLEGDTLISAIKTPTTPAVTDGIATALEQLVSSAGGGFGDVDAVVLGTTHFTNAVVQRRDLTRVAAIRIGLPASASLVPFIDWPADLADIVRGGVFLVQGGHEYDGREIVPFDETTMREVAARIQDGGWKAAAISSVFSPLTAEHESRAADILRSVCSNVEVTLSHQLGRIGLLERENAALLNAGTIDLARRTTRSLRDALEGSGIRAPLFLTQNDGTLANADAASAFPVYSFASGPTNSMRGAAFLSDMDDAIVIDVGGTTTDIGCLRAGFPREANNVVEVGGVRTLFRMPDLLSIGLGGGSVIERDGRTVGPVSVGHRITEQARIFGGDTLTASDVGVAAGMIAFGDPSRVANLSGEVVARSIAVMADMIFDGVDRMRTDARAAPLIAVGGGAFLVPDRIPGVSEVIRVEHHTVANAIGAAIAQVSGETDRVFHGIGRDAAIEEATTLAEQDAVDAGAARQTLKVVDVEDLPISYLPGDARRVRVRVIGDIGR